MAYAEVRHAAGRPTYAVYELLQGRPALDPRLRSECDSFEQAVDYALMFLDRVDPDRTGRVEAIEIVRRVGNEARARVDVSVRAGLRPREVGRALGVRRDPPLGAAARCSGRNGVNTP